MLQEQPHSSDDEVYQRHLSQHRKHSADDVINSTEAVCNEEGATCPNRHSLVTNSESAPADIQVQNDEDKGGIAPW